MANKPKLDFLLNVPTTVVLGNNFKNGTGEYGSWYGWGVAENGVEKTLFADDDLQAKIAPFGSGAMLSITKSQIPGSRQFAWHVQPANGAVYAPPPTSMPPPSRAPYAPAQQPSNTWDRDAHRADRVARALEAITDAEKVLDPAVWSREDVRALAISFLIDEHRQGIAPPDEGANF